MHFQTASDPRNAPGLNPATSSCDCLPIVVDLDNTLLVTDSLQEQIAECFFTKPGALVKATLRLLRGRAAMKAAFSKETDLSTRTWPLCEDLVEWLRSEAAKGREIHLCSAAHQAVVEEVARRLGIFTTAVGSVDINLKGTAKADYLTRAFPDGFVYVGDSRADLAVWKVARGIVLVQTSKAVTRAAHNLEKPIEAEFRNPPLTAKDFFRALRIHHWSKNALIFVPLFLGHAWNDLPGIVNVVLGLFCLLLVTSATYLLNDIADLEADRRHWSKRHRALASGRLSIPAGFLAAGGSLAIGFAGALVLSYGFALALGSYLVITLAYSFGLKRVPIVDTLIIAILFTTRLIMGVELLDQPYSEWLLTFSMFFFFSLAVAKRHTEIIRAGEHSSHSLASRGYRVEDGAFTLTLGVSSGVASLLIMVLFIVEEVLKRDLYSHPKMLGGIPIVLAIWVGRIWLLAHRGEMKDDPVSFALRDKASLMLGTFIAVIFVLAL